MNQRPPDDGARGDPGMAGSGPAPEIADLDSSFDLSAFAPETLRQPVPGHGDPRPRAPAVTPLGLSGILESADPVEPDTPSRRLSGVGFTIPPVLAGLWDRPERAVAAAGALVILLALAIAVVALGREGEPSAAALAGVPEAPVATTGPQNTPPDAPAPQSARTPAAPAPRATVAADARGRAARDNSGPRRVAASAAQRGSGSATSIGTAGTETHGWIALRSPIPMEMWQDGRLLGRMGARVRLPAGRHVVDLVNEQLNYRERRTVAVAAGATSQLRLDAPRGSISLNAVPWAAVWIDGRRVGETPLGELPVALGEHVIRFEHPQLGERRETVLVRAGEVTRVSVNLRQ